MLKRVLCNSEFGILLPGFLITEKVAACLLKFHLTFWQQKMPTGENTLIFGRNKTTSD